MNHGVPWTRGTVWQEGSSQPLLWLKDAGLGSFSNMLLPMEYRTVYMGLPCRVGKNKTILPNCIGPESQLADSSHILFPREMSRRRP